MSIRSVGDWSGSGLAHEAFVFSDEEEVRARCVPFVQEALDRDEPVVVVAGDQVRRMLREVFGDRTDEFAVFQAAEVSWLGGAGTLAAYQHAMRPLVEAGRPWRLVGEPIWVGRPDGAVWSRFEAVANDAFADYPYYSLCLHDRRRVGQEHLDAQLRAHPMVWGDAGPVQNPDYLTTQEFLRSVQPSWTPAPASARAFRVANPRRALPDLECQVRRSANVDRADEVLLAVYELVTNALKAAGAAQVTHWLEEDWGVWEVSDEGSGLHDASAGYWPPGEDLDTGRGLWLARSLADESTVRTDGPGTALRLYFRLPAWHR